MAIIENNAEVLKTKMSQQEQDAIWAQVLGKANDEEEGAGQSITHPDELNVGKVAWKLAREKFLPRPRKEQFDEARKIVASRQKALLDAKPRAAKSLTNTDIFPFPSVEDKATIGTLDAADYSLIWQGKNGTIKNEHSEDYFAAEGVNSSRLKTLLKSEKHYQRYEPTPKKAHLNLGTNIHLSLVPNAHEKYAVADVEYGWNSKDATMRGIEFFCRLTGTEIQTLEVNMDSKHELLKSTLKTLIEKAEESVAIVSAQDKVKIDRIITEVFTNELAMELLTAPGANELSLYWDCPNTGIRFKIRPDRLIKHPTWGNVLISIKSATDVEPEAFEKAYHKYGYGISDAMYLHILRKVTGEEWNSVATITVQTTNPYLCQVYFNHAKDIVLRYGHSKFMELKEQLTECLKTDTWHGYEEVAEPTHRNAIRLNLPMWVDYE